MNKSPTRTLPQITPEERWTGCKPDLSHMKIFGCKAMVHIPKEKRQKLDPKSRELTFVGYSDCTKGYRFIDMKTKQIVMSRDAVFLEESFYQNIHNINSESLKVNEQIFQQQDKNDNSCHEPILSHSEIENSNFEETNNDTNQNDFDSSTYEDPNDETYIPTDLDTSPETCHVNLRHRRQNQQESSDSESFSLADNSELSSFLCMNSESAMSYLDNEPQSHDEALNCENSELWKKAMEAEYQSLVDNNTWTVVNLPDDKKVIPCKWVFKTKRNDTGNVTRYKARLVIKGFKQTKGIDYHEVYAPVVRYTSIRYLIGLAAKYRLKIHQMDAITAFLQGEVEEEIYMTLPPCYETENKVCRLNKALYGLKQASRQWNKKLNAALLEIGLKRSMIDPCIYNNKNDMMFIAVYVDDLLYFFNNDKSASHIKEKLQEKFKMKDLGKAQQCIGLKILQSNDLEEISLDQSQYIEKILHRFKMSDCKPASTPFETGTQLKKADNLNEVLKNVPFQEAVGCLLYLSQGTRPDITFAVNTASRFNNNPTMQHWIAVKRIFRYLKGTIDNKLTFRKNSNHLIGYCDADWASDAIDRRSCTGYLFIFQGACISWNSKKQTTVALSSTEAEYMSLASAVQEALWLQQLQNDICACADINIPITIYCDNQSAISISGSDAYQARSKHIDVRYHFIKEKIAAGQICTKYMGSDNMVADALTKGIPHSKLHVFATAMGLRSREGVEVNANR